MKNYEDVTDFNLNIMGVKVLDKPNLPNPITSLAIARKMAKTVDQLNSAIYEHDLFKMTEETMDLIYFALGLAHRMGIPFEELWNELHECNMHRGPAGEKNVFFRRPEYTNILKEHGYVQEEDLVYHAEVLEEWDDFN